MSELLERVLEHEGFRAKPYLDTLGVSTFGHGLTFITEFESKNIVNARLEAIAEELAQDEWVAQLPDSIRWVLYEMGFQLGMNGLSKFKKMWIALELNNFEVAADEMLDSLWAQQTPERAQELSDIVRNHKSNELG